MPYTFTMPTDKSFDFTHILGYMERSANECMHRIADRGVEKLIAIGDKLVLVRIEAQEGHSLAVQCPNATNSAGEAAEASIVEYVREWFDMDRDLLPFFELARQDDVLSGAVAQFAGLRIVGIENLFEALCWGIMGQQINLGFAYTLKRRFVERYGESLPWKDHRFWLFPSPERIAALDPAELKTMQFTERKADYIIGVARLMAQGAFSKSSLLELPNLEAREKALTAIRGIGPWTANYVLMRCLRMPEAFPVADVGLRNALKHVLGGDAKLSIAEINALASDWGEWKSYATFYLWRLLY